MSSARGNGAGTPTGTGVGRTLDDLPLTAFHRRLTVYSAGGPFLDGFVLGIIGVALTQLTPQWHLSGAWQGVLGASALIGLFAGGLLGGYVTDRVGRTVMYTLDLLLVAICSVAQFFSTGPVMLLALRFVLGIAIGADYPIATSLLAEFAPRRKRGSLLGWLTAMWAAGNAAAYLVGEALKHLGPDAWRWMLLSPAVFAILLVVARWGTPESPRWLAARGRVDEARAALHKVFGPDAELEALPEETEPARFRTLVSGPYLRRTVFVAVFWTCSILPIYAIYAFGPALLAALGLDGPGLANVGEASIGLLFLIGCVAATLVANRFGRRTLLIGPFAVATVALFALGFFPHSAVPVVATLFAVYAIAIGGPTIMQWIYPNELFPTEVRATAVGVGTSVSRIGAAVGTFLTPILLASAGVGVTMLIAAAVSTVGVVVSVFLAPETRHQSLAEASAR
ncbi:MFS transporter [Amycolatopsis rhabdoformis]|uniref:MFS transporter n=1 Tax=Amycolatopsis rhabdoformis TaxID=1448059 RepID=A0ABZ1IIF7_9PSEU|nr:MFS transporter [Amycolatopsis rhabdoformis]WSE33924.1 MFS transporter [Amycolatopsis rhabdoformis]